MIKSVFTFSEATYYWDLCDCRIKGAEYSVFLDGEKVLTTDKTDFTIENLEADKTYNLEVYAQNNSEKLILVAEKFRTKRMPDFVNVRDFGAVGDGKTVETKALQSAIDAVCEGQTLYFPAGTYLTGAIKLHSNMDVYLDDGATIQGTANPEDYLPRIKSRFEGLTVDSYSPLIGLGDIDFEGGINAENVMLYGKGTILGGGRELCDAVIESEAVRLADYMKSLGAELETFENHKTIPGRARPRLIYACNTKNITLNGLTMGNGSCWNIHFVFCEDVLTYNCKIVSHGVWNGDGWDPDSSVNCTIFNCEFDTSDDCIAIKSGKNPEGDVVNRPTRNVKVFDCRFVCGHALAVGSEMSGGVDGVYVWDCDAGTLLNGLSIKTTKKRGGYVKNIYVNNSTFTRLGVIAVKYNDDGKGAKHPPFIGDFYLEDVVFTGERVKEDGTAHEVEPIMLTGVDEGEYRIHNINLKNVTIDTNGRCKDHSIVLRSVSGLNISNLSVR